MTDTGGPFDVPEWQRLSPWSVVFIFVRTVTRVARENLPVLVGAGAGIALIERIGLREAALGAGFVLALAAVASVIYYRRFRFRVEDDVLRVQKGLVERTELRVVAANVQHLALEQPLHLRVFGLVRFKVDTPGGLAAEVELPGITLREAQRLRGVLATGEAEGPAAAPEEDVVYRVSPLGLTLHGIASSYVYAVVAAVAPFLQLVERRLLDVLGDTALAARLAMLAERPLLTGTGVVLAIMVLLTALSVAVAWLRFHGFTLVRNDGRYTQRSGLVGRQEQVLSVPKLQSVEWVQTALGRLLNCSHLICRQVGGSAPGRDQAAESFVIPGLEQAAAHRLARTLCPGLDARAPMRRVHQHYRRVLFLRTLLLLTLALVGMAALTGSRVWLILLLAAPLPSWLLAHLRWRAVAFSSAPRYLQVRKGLLRRSTAMFAVAKVQSVRLSQTWFQRRRQLATLTLILASGPVTIPYIRVREADRLINHVVHRVESAHFRKPAASPL